jgi:M6 family metalloprotease-like protein
MNTLEKMKKRLFTIFTVILFITQETNAVPAYPYPIQYQLPDGTVITISLKGDEWVNWAASSDGYSLLLNANGFYEYAVKDEANDLVLSGIRSRNEKERSPIETAFLDKIQKDLRYSDNQKASKIQKLRGEQSAVEESDAINKAPAAMVGNVRAPLILVGFQGKPFSKSKEEFEPLMNQIGYTANGTITGSLRDYFKASSYDQLDFQVDIFGPYTLSHGIAYYDFKVEGDPGLMVQEAVLAASADGCDFSNYDMNDDGIVDAVHVIFAGYGQESGAPAGQAIWSHKSNVYPSIRLNGKRISPYSCSPELRDKSGNNIAYIGATAHELSHVFGLPDLYDTDYEDNGQAVDVGPWDIMASGTWNDGGRTPALHSAWSRDFLGWVPATELSAPTEITLPHPDVQGVSYKINTPTALEYFLVENRQRTGWDSYLPSGGMLIYHVDENNSGWKTNCINCVASRRGLYVKQAATSAMNGRTNDPYPSRDNTSFTDTSSPNSLSWAGAETKKPITEITHNTADGTISFVFKGGSTGGMKELNGLAARPNEGTVSGDGLFKAGTVVTLSAVPLANYRFVCWKSGNTIVSTDNPFSFTLTEDTTVIAFFKNKSIIETIYADDFESYADDWPFANETQTNQWVKGTNTAATKSAHSIYISDNNGVDNQYNTSAESIVHFYKDIELPATTDHYQLSFDWKGNGELYNQSKLDYLEVRILDTDVTPIGGTDLTGAPLKVLGNSDNWQQAFILLPDSCIGTTKRLVFTWKNNDSEGTQPPAAVDNIEIASISFFSDLSVNLSEAGTLKDSVLNAYFVTKLTVSGAIDARDIRFIRDQLSVLEELDLSGATIVSYTGTEGTMEGYTAYPDNELPQMVFYGNESLTTVALPKSLTAMGPMAFLYCMKLDSIALPLNLTSIGILTFAGCTELKSITIPKNVTSILGYAFAACTGLEEIYNLNPVPIEIAANVFSEVDTSNCRLKVLANSCDEYNQANIWKNFKISCEYELSADAALSDLTVSEGMLAPDFDSNVVRYTVDVESRVENITINATTAHSYAVATGVGAYTLGEGENNFNVHVTAEDGISAKTYTLTVNRDIVSGIEGIDSQTAVYPNPTDGMVYIRNAANETPEVTVYNVTGKVMLNTTQNPVDLSAFPAGVYLLRIGNKITKIVKN